MSATWDPSLQKPRDLARLLIGDTDTTSAHLQDETYDALIAKAITGGASTEGAPYCAAAQAGDLIAARWATSTAGIVEKEVSKLRIKYGDGKNAATAFRDHLNDLRATCTRLSLSAPAVLKAW